MKALLFLLAMGAVPILVISGCALMGMGAWGAQSLGGIIMVGIGFLLLLFAAFLWKSAGLS